MHPRVLWWVLPAGVPVPEWCRLPQCDRRVYLCSRLYGKSISNMSEYQWMLWVTYHVNSRGFICGRLWAHRLAQLPESQPVNPGQTTTNTLGTENNEIMNLLKMWRLHVLAQYTLKVLSVKIWLFSNIYWQRWYQQMLFSYNPLFSSMNERIIILFKCHIPMCVQSRWAYRTLRTLHTEVWEATKNI